MAIFKQSALLIILTFQKIANAQYEFQNFVSLFENCFVKLYNYRNVDLLFTYTKVTVVNNATFGSGYPPSLKWNKFLVPKMKFHCVAVFHILPPLPEENKLKATFPKSKNMKRPPADMDDERLQRYQILIDHHGQGVDIMLRKLETIFNYMYHTYGMMINVEGENLEIPEKVLIVNSLHQTRGHIVLVGCSLSSILVSGTRSGLDKAIEIVNDIRNNPFPTWRVMNVESFYTYRFNRTTMYAYTTGYAIQRMKREPYWKSDTRLLTPISLSSESLESVLIAVMALGNNVTMASANDRVPTASIWIRSSSGEFVWDMEAAKLGFISCSDAARYTPLGSVFIRLMSIFQSSIYLALVATYLGPCVILGLLYHCKLKKNMQKRSWIKWDPFTWGIRCLIMQPGDRRWNSKRIGWMGWITLPCLFGSVLISYAFRGRNIDVLNRPMAAINTWISLNTLTDYGVTPVTDLRVWGDRWKKMWHWLDYYERIGEVVARNSTVAYVSYQERVDAVANVMDGRCRYGNWGELRMGSVWKWDAPYYLRNGWLGFDLMSWRDKWLVDRFRVLGGGSGIAAKWREVMSGIRRRKGAKWRTRRDWVGALSMRANIRFMFLLGFCSLAIGFMAWVVELILGKTRKKRLNWVPRKKRGTLVEVIIEQDGVPGNGAGNKDDKLETDDTRKEKAINEGAKNASGNREDLVAAALTLVEEIQTKPEEFEEYVEAAERVEKVVTVKRHSQVSWADLQLPGGCESTSEEECSSISEVKAEVETSDGIHGRKLKDRNDLKAKLFAASDDDAESALGSELETLMEVGSEFDDSDEDVPTKQGSESIAVPLPPTAAERAVREEDLDAIHVDPFYAGEKNRTK